MSIIHCEETKIFKPNQYVKAFTYTEYSIYPHDHYFYEMNIVLGGTGMHQIENRHFRVKRGDVFVIPPMTVHSYYDTEHLEVYHVIFKNEFIKSNEAASKKIPGYLKLMEIEPFLRQTYSDKMFLHLTPSQIIEIQSDLKFIDRKSAFYDASLFPMHEHTAWKIIYYLSYLLEKQTEDKQSDTKTNYRRQILDTLEYLSGNYSEKITIPQLAERVYLSRSTFLRSFSAVCGCSPIEYLTQYRVKKAIELLESSTMSKTEIAHTCGFYDLSHMERSLKSKKQKPLF